MRPDQTRPDQTRQDQTTVRLVNASVITLALIYIFSSSIHNTFYQIWGLVVIFCFDTRHPFNKAFRATFAGLIAFVI